MCVRLISIGGLRVLALSWPEGIALSEALAREVRGAGYVPDIIVAISRGGLVPARIISDVLGVDDIITLGIKHWRVAERRAQRPVLYHVIEAGAVRDKRVLVVDEVADTGSTLALAKSLVEMLGALEVKTAVIHLKATSSFAPDFYAERLEDWVWVAYPWSRCEDVRELRRRGMDVSGLGGEQC